MIARQLPACSRVLVINPNTSTSLTDSFEPILCSLALADTSISYWTCPDGPAMITSVSDMHSSAAHCLPHLLELASDYDGFLAACYADHPLVGLLQSHVGDKPVVGIFDASIYAALSLLGAGSTFGIITTLRDYEDILADGVKARFGDDCLHAHLAGVTASGVDITDFKASGNKQQRAETRRKVMQATRKLLSSRPSDNIEVLCMGGVVLAGMEPWVHEACSAELGLSRGSRVKVVDQLAAGMLSLDALLSGKALHEVDYRLALK